MAAFLISAGSRLGGLAGINLVAIKPSNTWIAYAIPAAVIIIGLVIAQSGMRPQRKFRAAGVLSSVSERLIGMLTAPFRRRRPAADQPATTRH